MAIASLRSAPTRLGKRLFNSQLLETIVSPNGVDRYAELIDPIWSVRDVRAKVVSVERTTPRSVTLVLKPNGNWSGHYAGQQVGLTTEVNGRLLTRFYSPASSAARKDGLVEFTISVHPEGKVSQHLFSHAHEGMVVGLSPAEGDFTLPVTRPRNLLLIGGGSGITPVMSMLRTLIDENHDGQITFVHYARTPDDAIYADELAAIEAAHENINVVHSYTRESGPASALTGHLTRKQLKGIAVDHASAETYVCGPNALIDAAEKIWKKDGLASRLHTETFVLPEPVIVEGDATGLLGFSKSATSVENDGTTILAQAEASGLSPRCGCRMGLCHTCIAHVEEGVVRDVRTGEIKTVKNEHVQICVNAPVGDIQIQL